MKPTEAQIKEFWERCGLHYEDWSSAFAPNQGGAWVDSNNKIVDIEQSNDTPPIDLNNLFKYAVPKVCDYLTQQGEWFKLRRLWEAIEQALADRKLVETAVFNFCWEVIHNES